MSGPPEVVRELERELAITWSRDHLAVYADHLQALGDPRGELIAIDLAGRPAASEGRRAQLVATWLADLPAGGDTATVLNWTLGNQVAGINIDSETSVNYPRTCTVESLGADVTVKLKCSNAAPATAWAIAGAAGADQFRMQAKGGSGTGAVFNPAYADLTGADQLLIPVLANAATSTFYLKFYTPTSSTDATSKTITVTATATSPP